MNPAGGTDEGNDEFWVFGMLGVEFWRLLIFGGQGSIMAARCWKSSLNDQGVW